MLTALGYLWLAGIAVDWGRVHISERRWRVPLPTYPFERKKFWIEARKVASSLVASPAASVGSEYRSEASSGPDLGGEASSNEGAGPATGVPLYARPNLATQYEPPQTEAEKTLAGVWRDVLGVKDVGVNDNFFDLGGDSLLALTLMSQIERVMGERPRPGSLIEAPTIRQFAELLGGAPAQPSATQVRPSPTLFQRWWDWASKRVHSGG
jgi:acyl carrier protein